MHLSNWTESVDVLFGVPLILSLILILAMKRMVDVKDRRLKEQENHNEIMEKQLNDRQWLQQESLLSMSHELRTPINVILSALQLQEDSEKADSVEELQARNKRICSLIKSNSYRLLRVINNLIDINRIEAKAIIIGQEPVNIGLETRKIFEAVKPWFEKKAVRLSFEEVDLNLGTVCDPSVFEQILLNLLSNALKFTPEGGDVLITALRNRISGDIVISVKDSGIGIPQDSQQRIFDKFVRLEHDLVQNAEGNGSGLAIVKGLIEMEGGSVQVVSSAGKGAEFRIRYPVRDNVMKNTNPGIVHRETLEYRVLMEFSEILQD